MNIRGFTLIEILIVIAVIGILVAVALPFYSDIQTKAKMEAQTKELYSTIVSTRVSAMTNRQRSALFLGPSQLVFKTYSSSSDLAGRTVTTKNLDFIIQQVGSATPFDVSSNKIEFDTSGITNQWMTIEVTPTKSGAVAVIPQKYDAGKNCIVVHLVRTNIGRMKSAALCEI